VCTLSSEPVYRPEQAETNPARFRIVGIGASAGGLESLEQFFMQLPPNPGMAFVVVQHLSPDLPSVMDELLARHCDLPIQHAADSVKVEPNRVYILPPGKEMIIQDRRLLLSDKERSHGLTLPIDHFFRSLAQDAGADAVGIVLSGSGSDGSRGIRFIKRMGGRVFVENPDSAKFDGMPLSALATGMVDASAEAGQIARLLVEDGDTSSEWDSEPDETYNETPLEAVLRLLRNQFGLDFSEYKTSTVSRRILRRLQMSGCVDLAEYAQRLRPDSGELGALYHDLLIGVTRFFRDPDAFDFLEQHVFPDILDRVPESEQIRVWVAGCATGEEAYSMAMLLFELLNARGRQLNIKILSTDVHTASLAQASAGLYGEEQLEHVNERLRERFFKKVSNGYHISQDLRQLIVFAPHNVIKDAPFTKMHLISCRNLLIYFEPPAQKNVLSLFHFGLAANGYLFLGPCETTGGLAQEFDTVNAHWKIYRKRRDVRLLEPLRHSIAGKASGSPPPFLGEPRSTLAGTQLLNVYEQLLDRYMPPSFLVNEDGELIDSFGGAERMFQLGKRRPPTNVLDLLEGDMRTVVAGAIQRALKKDGVVHYTGVPVNDGETTRRSVLSAHAFTNPRTNSTNVLISIESESAAQERDGGAETGDRPITTTQASHERLNTLEADLSYTRETLQATTEELQTSNEKIQATNEELVASNEKHQSTNEELHSVNEELYTVNAELQRKIAELRELNADMQHFLESTDVGILFLDRNLYIRKYTPKITSVFHIQPQDSGRSIRHLSHSLRRPTLLEDIERALTEGVITEDEVRDSDGTTFFLRIFPYRSSRGGADAQDPRLGYIPGNIEGVVMSLTDTSALERVRARLRQMSAIVESCEDAIIGTTLEGAITARRREEFLAMLSHELRNPLAAVVGAARVMRAKDAKPDSIDKARQIVERQSGHMARLLDDLLDVSRITRDGIELRKEDLDMRDVIRDAIEALAPILSERQSQLTTDLPEYGLPVRGDAARMQQVIVNLVSNAARYSSPGSPIHLSCAMEGDFVVMRVRDQGRGISPSMLSDIFELFVQDGQGLERSIGGLGIGLTLVRQIVELHGGKVSAHSEGIGKGSEFVVALQRQPHAVIHHVHEPEHVATKRRLLIVEDQEDSREMLRVLLESMGHVVVEEGDGRSAVVTIEREHPDIAFVDIGLPIMSGYDVARRIRENPQLDDVILVALTGYGRDTDVEAAKTAGFDAHITKPADLQVIDEILTRKV
jgi:two-component system CheB/CheR fusion protein